MPGNIKMKSIVDIFVPARLTRTHTREENGTFSRVCGSFYESRCDDPSQQISDLASISNPKKHHQAIDPSGTRNFVPRKRIRSEEYPEGFGEGYLRNYLLMKDSSNPE
jgi:hypothetical protein